MNDLYFVAPDQCVFIFSRSDDWLWKCSRLPSTCKQKFSLVFGVKGHADSWVVQDNSPGQHDETIGHPDKTSQTQDRSRPPLGPWVIWGGRFTVTDRVPQHAAIETPFEVEVPCATLVYSEEGSIGRLEVVVHSAPIVDEDLEYLLNGVKRIIVNLARRPPMVLFIRSDGRQALVPSLRHIRRLLSFISDNGTELVLVGRGHAIVLNPGILGSVLVNLVRWVQRLVPSPWKEVIVPTLEAGDAFLAEMAASEVREYSIAASSNSRSQAAEKEPPKDAVSASTPLVAETLTIPEGAQPLSSMTASPPSTLDNSSQAGIEANGGLRLHPVATPRSGMDDAPQSKGNSRPPIFVADKEADAAGGADLMDTESYQSSRTSWFCACEPCESSRSSGEPGTHLVMGARG